jgi:ADP-ribosylglycohydrolase/uridine kinase
MADLGQRFPSTTVDRMRGMLKGVAVGDACGSPHEFGPPGSTFTGNIKLQHKHTNRYGYRTEYSLYQVTDDTEMTIALLHAMGTDKSGGGYTLDRALCAYHEFVCSGTHSLGKNTRALLFGYKTNVPSAYKAKFIESFPDTAAREAAQSNGHLMRCSPFALICRDEALRRNLVEADTMLTNPSQVAVQIALIYTDLLAVLLIRQGQEFDEPTLVAFLDTAKATYNVSPTVAAAIDDACLTDGTFVRVVDTKGTRGWTCHSFSIALWALRTATSASDGFTRVIQRGGDTDTNAAIAGALLGAKFGDDRMMSDKMFCANWEGVANCKPVIHGGKTGQDMKIAPRPDKYHPIELLSNLEGVLFAKHEPVDFEAWFDSIHALEKKCRKRPIRQTAGVVIGITGASQSGKTTTAKQLRIALNSYDTCVLHQDSFRLSKPHLRARVDGKPSWEGPQFTDFGGLLECVKQAKMEYAYVIVEGYMLFADTRVTEACDYKFVLESDEDTCAHRRTKAPKEWATPAEYYRACVWPTHLSYMATLPGSIVHVPMQETADRVRFLKSQPRA